MVVAAQTRSRCNWLVVLGGGGICVIAGAVAPWAWADGVAITALGPRISFGASLYGLVVILTGVAALATSLAALVLGVNRALAVFGAAVGLIGVAWSLIFPALVDVEQQERGGQLQASFGPGAYLVAIGVVGVTLGAGMAFLPSRGRRAISIAVALVTGGALASALR